MKDTIVAIATPAGRGGVSVIRMSGPNALDIAQKLCKIHPKPRQAHLCTFLTKDHKTIDKGLLLFFAGPGSFTGEDVVELHGHGNPVVMDMLLRRTVELGARIANPGEFSERAFLNDKIDLVQAEAIAQIIAASTEQAALSAQRSLKGEFSSAIEQMISRLIELRMYVEAAIDFPEEEINFLSDTRIIIDIENIISALDEIGKTARSGALLSEGINAVIIGKPNVGKSTLLNNLTGEDSAIVTSVAGTTRDTIKAQVNFDGLAVNITDTAGIRNTEDIIEKVGIERSWQALELADVVMLVVDATKDKKIDPLALYPQIKGKKVVVVYNKIDQADICSSHKKSDIFSEVYISAQSGLGVEHLRQAVKDTVEFHPDSGTYTARRRHLTALHLAAEHVQKGQAHLQANAAGELLAEELRIAQQRLEEITGRFTSDDLLGKIFAEFCIGK